MGFYAPDSLVHEAEHRDIPVLGLDVNASEMQCAVEKVQGTVEKGQMEEPRLGVRLGLGYVKDVLTAEVRALVVERERGGPFASLGELAARVGASRVTLEQLAWSGACDSLVGSAMGERARRREALWQLGVASTGRALGGDTQLALPLELPAAPRLRPLGRWQRLIADYATSGVTVGDHVMAALRPRLRTRKLTSSAQLARLPNGCSVTVAGLVIARQRPGTAKGTMFLLFEDECGTINLIVPKVVYERHRHLARAEPLLLARGQLERSEGVVNVIVRELEPLERLLEAGVLGEEEQPAAPARVHHLPDADRAAATGGEGKEGDVEVGSSMRAMAPPVQSFAMGRRR
jgi:error-prone DNA polymerase